MHFMQNIIRLELLSHVYFDQSSLNIQLDGNNIALLARMFNLGAVWQSGAYDYEFS